MDPLTHTLAGANLAATRLGEKTRLAAAALVIGANLPDIDGITYFIDPELALGFRRGWTHGVLALVLWPFLLTGALLLYDRLRPDPQRPVHVRWLFALSAIGIWSHPALDWLNTYGMRWLMPFRPTWFYGDAVYIMDPWLWLVLGVGWLIGRRPSWGMLAGWAVFGGWTVWMVARRAPEYLPVIAFVAIVLLLALVWRPAAARAHAFAAVALAVAAAYIVTRVAVSAATERAVVRELGDVTRVMAGPDPIDPTKWSFVAQRGGFYHYGRYDWRRGGLSLTGERTPVARDTPEFRAAMRHPSVHGFATWVRFPAYEIVRKGAKTEVILYDARRSGAARNRVVTLD